MHKVEALEKKIDFLIQEFRGYFLILLALLTGEASIIYAVISRDKPMQVLFLGVIGVIFIISIYLKLQSIRWDIMKHIKELEEA